DRDLRPEAGLAGCAHDFDDALGDLRHLQLEQLDEKVIAGAIEDQLGVTVPAALAGFHARLPVAHVEAGLRTNDRTNPFPEEMNRRLISELADLHLAPQRLWSSEGFYSYPVLEAMLGTPQVVAARLLALCERKLLGRSQLNDRVRHCPACDGAHLNFIDLCPNCRHLDIVQQPFLHCFTCGAVAPEERFVDQDGLRCPNCRARLRHIGTDYDRPLENFACNSCGHTFIEPEVQARCMHCSTLTPPDRLTPRTVCTYELTDLGVQAARSGTMEDVFALLDTVNSVSPSYFLNLVNWLLALARRHNEERFTIIGLRLQNMVELRDRLGPQPVLDMMDALAARLRALVRSTHLSTRTGQQMFWLLLPKTGRPQHRIVLDRILALRDLLPEGEGIDFETVVFNAPEDMQPDETGKLLLARLEGELT
ncbi:MAG: diguanylate cyclase, partial [Opitutae bacterium]|nr:diguanylate cyclase [Opitutae bacterium]